MALYGRAAAGKKGLRKFRIPRFTRTLSQWLNLLTDTGFLLERMEEPRPSDETVAACPALQDAQVVSYFLHLRVRKPAADRLVNMPGDDPDVADATTAEGRS